MQTKQYSPEQHTSQRHQRGNKTVSWADKNGNTTYTECDKSSSKKEVHKTK